MVGAPQAVLMNLAHGSFGASTGLGVHKFHELVQGGYRFRVCRERCAHPVGRAAARRPLWASSCSRGSRSDAGRRGLRQGTESCRRTGAPEEELSLLGVNHKLVFGANADRLLNRVRNPCLVSSMQ